MMQLYEIILIVVTAFCFFLLIFVIAKNKFNFAIVKIQEAEDNLSIYLDKEKDLIERTIPVIKKELKYDEFLSELDSYDKEKMNLFQLNKVLSHSYNELMATIADNEKLLKSDTINKILDELNDNEENRIGTIKFYNDSVVTFNKLVRSFPSNIVGLFLGYRKKDFYNDEDKEIEEILKEDEEVEDK